MVSWLTAAYKDWSSAWTRDHVLKQVQRAKTQILNGCFDALDWKMPTKMPAELANFFALCRLASAQSGQLDYTALISTLGGDPNLKSQEADRNDMQQFAELIEQLQGPE